MLKITSLHFSNYKSFENYSVSISDFNILVGPNNSGKSTVIGAFRLLAEALRKARAKKPTLVIGPTDTVTGYHVDFKNISVAVENVFHNYDSDKPAKISFRLSNGNKLLLYFPEVGKCLLIPQSHSISLKSTAQFKRHFDVSIGFVPILGPVEHDEILYLKEAARLALVNHTAARNFRNIWYHYPDDFQQFRELLRTTWPGMDIEAPEVDHSYSKPRLHMFCPEERMPRELFWAGFGFQVWCQMLTYIVQNKNVSTFLIDEPDIYLHSDLQLQLLSILKELGPDIILATHSTELIMESDPDDILIINKKERSAKRIKDPSKIQLIFSGLGSNINPIITQIAKTKKVIFVEGKDFRILSLFASRLKLMKLSTRADFAVIPAGGFNPQKVKNYIEGIQVTLGTKILSAVIFDKDYRSTTECEAIENDLNEQCEFVAIHQRKELENFLLNPPAIAEALAKKIKDAPDKSIIRESLDEITNSIKDDVFGNFSSHMSKAIKAEQPHLDDSTINSQIFKQFETKWNSFEERMKLVPGKIVFSKLNTLLQDMYKTHLTPSDVIKLSHVSLIPKEMHHLINALEDFRKK